MKNKTFAILTGDEAVFSRFRALGGQWAIHRLATPTALTGQSAGEVVVIDSAIRGLPPINVGIWREWCSHLRIVVISSNPNDEEGLAYLENGASGYCHAYAAEETLQQVIEVVANGELWVGRSLMTRLLKGIGNARQAQTDTWSGRLTEREREVAHMAANGESNLAIAETLKITERTVKAHMSAIFEKLKISDRLQLALKVHGIR